MALQQNAEPQIHTFAALRNGCSGDEPNEVRYQAAVYGGFPTATSASAVMINTSCEPGEIT